jgi:hypothetical protein
MNENMIEDMKLNDNELTKEYDIFQSNLNRLKF